MYGSSVDTLGTPRDRDAVGLISVTEFSDLGYRSFPSVLLAGGDFFVHSGDLKKNLLLGSSHSIKGKLFFVLEGKVI